VYSSPFDEGPTAGKATLYWRYPLFFALVGWLSNFHFSKNFSDRCKKKVVEILYCTSKELMELQKRIIFSVCNGDAQLPIKLTPLACIGVSTYCAPTM